MKHFKCSYALVFACFLLLMVNGLVSCKKNYLTDGGLAKAYSSYSTYDYLANHPHHDFDTVIMIINHFGLKDSVNAAGTFFAPTDFSINRFMSNEQITSMDSLYAHISSKFLTQFMFSDSTITLGNASINPVLHQNWADTVCGVKKFAYTYSAANSVFTYYILQYVQINGALDGSSGPIGNDPADAVLNCQTTGIKTSSGTNLNVLANTANLKGR
ncbi:MAG TPA: hypothetical protein VFQ86_08370 [Arachidicoccus soli]|nr:hypothetical protein [Arachidicoccus soli]